MISDGNTNHYVLMKSLSPFVSNNKKIKIDVCPYYLQNSVNHKIDYIIHKSVRVEFTNKETLEFTNYRK